MKALTFLLVMVSMIPVFGQNKLALSIQIAPVYGHTDSKINLGGTVTQFPATEIMVVSNGLSYSLGISARYAFTPKWSIATGIWASHAAVSKANIVQDGIPYTYRYEYNHPFTNSYKVPLVINYQSSTKRLSPYFSLGTTFDFRATSYVDLSGNGDYVPIKVGQPVIVTPLVGVGVLYSLTERMALIVQPTVQYNVESHSSYAYSHSYQLSLQTQLMYRF